ncbi:Molybdopterin molybdenumtransferase [Mycena indigotica]|uniref:Molybdopterin molybdenumtransferase n=1 Tax=Mycena indigotica TaxID=2126181 RepID=A0A8H6T840_9AGAR|nr:Molybdopterin molybdenumtransferase [Mycena indigotica]KAF7312082.1 Molybdopterin molybdenumtransferase [Mycena indigotica]
MSLIRVAVLTVSDTASANHAADKSGPAIRAVLDSHEGFVCKTHSIVADDFDAIRSTVSKWCAGGEVDWIVTTGGTGFGIRDQTPEAITPLIERHAPGLVHLMLSSSLQHTPLAALSRPVAGTIQQTLVVTLPGSVKAVKENLQALLAGGVVNHAVELIRGGSGRQVHATLVEPSNHAHHHHHHDHDHHSIPRPRTLAHDPSAGVSARHRISPYPLMSLEDALRIIQDKLSPLKTVQKPVTQDLRGHVLAENIHAPQDVPSTPTTSVDGYALRSTDSPGVYRVLVSSTHNIVSNLPANSIYRVNTGGPLPTATDAVIMVEDTRLVSALDGEEQEVECLVQVPKGENVRAPGSDVRKGDLVMQKGDLISSGGGEIGTLTFVGREEVEVYRRPIVAILSTGNELLDLQNPLSLSNKDWGGIWDTNRPSLQAALEGLGYDVIDLGIVPDDVASHVSALRRGLDSADIIISTGGTSMGPSDLLKPVLEQHFNGTIHFGRVTIKPGKPTTFASVVCDDGTSKPVFALPGNPASALVTFYVFVVPALRRLGGWPVSRCQFPRVGVSLASPMTLDFRTEFHRVVIRAKADGSLTAESTGGQRSSRVASLAGANGFVILPMRTEGKSVLDVGQRAEALVIGEILMS